MNLHQLIKLYARTAEYKVPATLNTCKIVKYPLLC